MIVKIFGSSVDAVKGKTTTIKELNNLKVRDVDICIIYDTEEGKNMENKLKASHLAQVLGKSICQKTHIVKYRDHVYKYDARISRTLAWHIEHKSKILHLETK